MAADLERGRYVVVVLFLCCSMILGLRSIAVERPLRSSTAQAGSNRSDLMEDDKPPLLGRLVNSLSKNGSHSHAWPFTNLVWHELELGWRVVLGSTIAFAGSALRSVGGVGGGGIFVPMLTLILGFDLKTPAAISKSMALPLPSIFEVNTKRSSSFDLFFVDSILSSSSNTIMAWLKALVLALSLAWLGFVADAAIVEHTFNVGNLSVRRLCQDTVITAVNGQMPGPTIEVNEGDTLVVHVINDSPYNMTIHCLCFCWVLALALLSMPCRMDDHNHPHRPIPWQKISELNQRQVVRKEERLLISAEMAIDNPSATIQVTRPSQSSFSSSSENMTPLHVSAATVNGDGYDKAVRKEPTIEKPAPVSAPPKDGERQLSKKELKKKEMAELDALLHEMGIANKDSNTAQNETADKKQLEQSSEGEKKESVGAPSENRILKKKKSKKEKSSKEQEEHDQNKKKGDIEAEVADASAVNVKERIKKVASMRKKKSSKEMDAEQLNKRASYLSNFQVDELEL
ncbi:hypothetical protein ZIOFF_068104 [Zingiber officinale]|uniref:Plastocyanin-like domain-containing protein n=1 Tax=Zingiber officinale TaxID=94328 RepID=A0A8J5CD58_ZINOF|nr:hypothetical protein ZIOFF_068104 [Zingiber officinale]